MGASVFPWLRVRMCAARGRAREGEFVRARVFV